VKEMLISYLVGKNTVNRPKTIITLQIQIKNNPFLRDILVMDDYGHAYLKDRTRDTFRWECISIK
jgi:hypothetical protein